MLWKTMTRWALAALAVPVAAAGVRRVGHAVEARRGPSGVTRVLARTADTLQTLGGRKPRRRRWRWR